MSLKYSMGERTAVVHEGRTVFETSTSGKCVHGRTLATIGDVRSSLCGACDFERAHEKKTEETSL